MAKRIEIGLELEGQDAIDFINYINSPKKEIPPQALACWKEAFNKSD